MRVRTTDNQHEASYSISIHSRTCKHLAVTWQPLVHLALLLQPELTQQCLCQLRILTLQRMYPHHSHTTRTPLAHHLHTTRTPLALHSHSTRTTLTCTPLAQHSHNTCTLHTHYHSYTNIQSITQNTHRSVIVT